MTRPYRSGLLAIFKFQFVEQFRYGECHRLKRIRTRKNPKVR